MTQQLRWRWLPALVLALFAGAAVAQATAQAWRGPRPSLALELEPGSDSGTWEMLASFGDLRDGRALAQRRLTLQAGTPGVVEVEVDGTVTLRLEITVDITGTRATWHYQMREGDTLLTEQNANLALGRPREASY